MRKATEFLTASRVPLPVDDETRLRLAQRTAGTLLFVGGLLSVAVVPLAGAAHLPGFHPGGVLVPAVAALAAAPFVIRARLTWRLLYATVVCSTGVISVGVYTAAGRYPLGPSSTYG